REIGFEDDLDTTVTIIEWPDRADDLLPADTIHITLDELDDRDRDITRSAHVAASGRAAARMTRVRQVWNYITAWSTRHQFTLGEIDFSHLQGDASTRSYAKLRRAEQSWLLMDSPRQPDGPPIHNGLPYSKIAHLAEHICPFVAIAAALRESGLSAPFIDDVDRDSGLAIIEDLGSGGFGDMIDAGGDLRDLYKAAVDVLVDLRRRPVPPVISDLGCDHSVPLLDSAALHIEVSLLLDWYVPQVLGERLTDAAAGTFREAWQEQFDELEQDERGWVLRDYHSPNLIWLPQRSGLACVGLIDFQDALVGHPAYDLVSLLQDARMDVPADVETDLRTHYMKAAGASEATIDQDRFVWAYALLGAQRNTKILGIFTRLAVRDGKRQYLRHIPRISRYLARNLQHPKLRKIKTWFETEIPVALAGLELPTRDEQ
ncbi:MAG: phosphotransferase, partial [Hyphomicrobiaceae bacterium]